MLLYHQKQKQTKWTDKIMSKVNKSTFVPRMNKMAAALSFVFYVIFVGFFFFWGLSERQAQTEA